MNIGNLIHTRRKEMGLTQKDLADGICAQALVSKIENGEHVPKLAILSKLERRLNFEKGELNSLHLNSDSAKEVQQLIDNIRSYLPKRDYKTINLLLDNNIELINRVSNLDKQVFFSWMKATVTFQLFNNSDQALEAFNKLPLDEVNDPLAIEIINSKGSILYQQGDFDQALQVFENGINRLNDLINYDIQAKILLNYALTLEEFGKDKKALYYITLGIELLVENNSLYLLADFHHNKGHLFYKIGDFEEAINNFEFALNLFKLQGNSKLQAIAQFALTDTNNQLNKRKEE